MSTKRGRNTANLKPVIQEKRITFGNQKHWATIRIIALSQFNLIYTHYPEKIDQLLTVKIDKVDSYTGPGSFFIESGFLTFRLPIEGSSYWDFRLCPTAGCDLFPLNHRIACAVHRDDVVKRVTNLQIQYNITPTNDYEEDQDGEKGTYDDSLEQMNCIGAEYETEDELGLDEKADSHYAYDDGHWGMELNDEHEEVIDLSSDEELDDNPKRRKLDYSAYLTPSMVKIEPVVPPIKIIFKRGSRKPKFLSAGVADTD